jgi:hypothetical protein
MQDNISYHNNNFRQKVDSKLSYKCYATSYGRNSAYDASLFAGMAL